jgi:hypothetical protein
MSYERVIPRDLFNESKLLKCVGRLALLIHDEKDGGRLKLTHRRPERGFVIEQDPADGGLYVRNLHCRLADGRKVKLKTTYNCKSPYPLCFEADGQYGSVFQDDGTFDPDFTALLDTVKL